MDKDKLVKIQDSVNKFISWASREIGKAEDDYFNFSTYSEIQDYQMASPIEQIMYAALKATRRLNSIDEDRPVSLCGKDWSCGLGFYPQFQVGSYRVDFHVTYGWYPAAGADGYYQKRKEVIVECDSQKFHERTEAERRYEKTRDRFLQSKGFKVFRFTGSEIVKEPMRVAGEIISEVTEIDDLLLSSNIED